MFKLSRIGKLFLFDTAAYLLKNELKHQRKEDEKVEIATDIFNSITYQNLLATYPNASAQQLFCMLGMPNDESITPQKYESVTGKKWRWK